jgi:hypothetical protein
MVITQKTWGPYGWKFMHMVALAYPNNPTNEDKENYKTFFTILSNILPCQMCAEHYKKNLVNFPLTDLILSSRDTLLKWTIDVHNEVNRSIGKKILDYDEAITLIKNNYEDKTTKDKTEDENKDKTKDENKDKTKVKIETFVQTDNQSINTKPNKKDNNFLYILFFLFISLVLIAVVYKKY